MNTRAAWSLFVVSLLVLIVSAAFVVSALQIRARVPPLEVQMALQDLERRDTEILQHLRELVAWRDSYRGSPFADGGGATEWLETVENIHRQLHSGLPNEP